MRIITGYTGDSNEITLVCRDGDKKYKRTITGEQAYLCIDRKDDTHAIQQLIEDRIFNKRVVEKNFTRLYTKYAGQMFKAKEELTKTGITHYEGDVPFVRRVLIDKQMPIGNEPLKFLLIDIETDDSNDEIKIGEDRIVSIATMDMEGNKKFFCMNEEKPILEGFAEVMKEFDVLVAWNGDYFDFPYLEKRFMKNKIYVNWRDFQKIDAMFLFGGGYVKLDDTGKKELGLEKIEHEGKIIDMFNNDRALLCKYNLRDVEIMYQLEKKFNLLKLRETLSEKANIFIEEAQYNSVIVDTMILWKVKELGLPYRFITKGQRTEEPFKGATVMKPPFGLHKNVIVLDFTSLYNRIMQTWNISPETLGGEDFKVPNSEITFAKEKGIIPHILIEMEEERNKYKRLRNQSEEGSEEYRRFDLLQNAVKQVLLSFYGVMGSVHGRYYHKDIAGSVTGIGRWLIKKSKELIEEKGYKVIYMDTDSLMIKYVNLRQTQDKDDVIETGERLARLLNNAYPEWLKEFGIEKCLIEMKFEKIYSKMIFVGSKDKATKKRYAALQSWEEGRKVNKLSIVGLEIVRGDWSDYTKDMQRKVIDMILAEKVEDELYMYLIEKMSEVRDQKLSMSEIMITQTLKKEMKDYKSKGPHVKVAQILKDRGIRIHAGLKITYVYVKEKGPIPIDEFKSNYDADYYWEKKIYPPTERIVKSVFPNFDWDRLKKIMNIQEQKIKTFTLQDYL